VKIKLLRTLIVALVASAALLLSLGHDEFREFDAAYIQQEMLKESAESVLAHRDQQPIYFTRSAVIESRYYSESAAITPVPILLALSTCILRC
jgi:transcriptional antiterminator